MPQWSWNKGLTKETNPKLAEIGRNISKAKLGKPNLKCKGIPKSEEHKAKLRKPKSPDHVLHVSLALKGRQPWNKGITGYSTSWKGRHQSIEARKAISEGTRKGMTPEVRKRVYQALGGRPTKPEQKLSEVIEKACPGKYVYTGDGSLLIQGYAPDFTNTNGQKKVIELFGDYWHSPKISGNNWKTTELGRLMLFNSFGFKCLVVWESELTNKPTEELIALVRKFNQR